MHSDKVLINDRQKSLWLGMEVSTVDTNRGRKSQPVKTKNCQVSIESLKPWPKTINSRLVLVSTNNFQISVGFLSKLLASVSVSVSVSVSIDTLIDT